MFLQTSLATVEAGECHAPREERLEQISDKRAMILYSYLHHIFTGIKHPS